MIFSRRLQDDIELKNSEMVFSSYEIVTPEYDWDDYKDLHVKGKTIVVVVNDPGFGSIDKSFCKGNEMTYYRRTYKYEEAARQGAAGLLIIHQTKPAEYPWSVVLNSASVSNIISASKRQLSIALLTIALHLSGCLK